MERLPDELLLNIFNHVSDFKSLGRCCVVSRRFRSLVLLVSSLLIPVDSFASPALFSKCPFYPALFGSSPLSTDDCISTPLYSASFIYVASIIHSLLSSLHKPLQSPGVDSSISAPDRHPSSFKHHTLVHHVLKNFSDLRALRLDLPSGELSFHDFPLPLLRWRAHFGSSLNRCLILAAAAADSSSPIAGSESAAVAVADNDSIPDSIYKKLGLALTISSLFVASQRCCLLQPIIWEHTTLESLVLTDVDGQGVLRMDRDQLEGLRKNPRSASLKSRTTIPAFRMRQWYAPVVELSCGVVLKGAMLVAVRPSSGGEKEEDIIGLDGWIEEEFDGDGEGMYAEAARMLVKEERTHYLEMI